MEIRQLRHFIGLAETGSFSRAAAALHLTQSALSRSIQTLEDSLGARLIDRVGKRNEVTPLGRHVLERARRVVQEADDLAEAARGGGADALGQLRVGLGSGPGALLMTALLRHMAQHHPGVRTEVQRGAPELQLLLLRERRLDALVVDVRRIVPAPDLQCDALGDLRAAFIVRRQHPLARRRSVPFAELLAYPVASIPLSDEVGRQLVGLYGPQANPQQMVSLCCEEVPSLIDTVRSTDAVYLGIRAAARAELQSGALRELKVVPALTATARFALVTLAGRTEGPAMQLLRKFVAQHLRD